VQAQGKFGFNETTNELDQHLMEILSSLNMVTELVSLKHKKLSQTNEFQDMDSNSTSNVLLASDLIKRLAVFGCSRKDGLHVRLVDQFKSCSSSSV